ncbi:Diazepam-binding inhibitor-like 5 [Seminavis robusta]|uniref:Diazepam-binding inhibitor-like 5 n=1 Tax=Seminavis robusta TaxID=568900 RepID=A0A9N8E4Y6_9STRA|nr:Diazepam-binding inhibitor-like 5 [Seminavis robusta]|eukprot:Sro524_g159960.1 Diazepam-binding inhibitor-like 5 (322) ;mRNA; r:27541-28506
MAALSTARASNRTILWTGAALLSVATAVVVLKRIRRRRKTDAPPKERNDDTVDPQLAILFEAATQESRQLRNISNTEKLILYSLYKQSKEGNAPDKSPGCAFNIVEKAKHSAWCRARGMNKNVAMLHYIEAVQQLQTNGSMDHGGGVDGDLNDIEGIDLLDDFPIDGGGLGNKPSSLATNAEDSGDGYNGQELTLAQTVLRAASQNDAKELQSLLKQYPELVNHRDEDGQSALHLAADKGASEALKALMDAGADVNAADGDGITVLHAAVIAENIEACKLLLDHGANAEKADVDGDTPRKCAEEDGSNEMKELFASCIQKT